MRRLWRDRRGSVAVLTALSFSLILGVTVLAIDFGSIFFESRRLQGAADAAALTAATNLSSAATAAQIPVSAVNWRGTVTPTVVPGTYTRSSAVAVGSRFVAGGTLPNAARVTLVEQVPTFFGGFFGRPTMRVRRTATAMRVNMASFSLGSRLASIDQGIANQLLSGLIGTTVSLTVGDFDALLKANVDALNFASALRTQLGLSAATFEQTLATSTTLPNVLQALATSLSATGQGGAAAAVLKLKAVVPATQTTLSGVLNLGLVGKQDNVIDGTSISLNGFSFLQTLLQVAGGQRQFSLDFGSGIPGLLSAKAVVALGQRKSDSPWIAFTDKGEPVLRTAQGRVYVDVTVLSLPALALLNVQAVRLPLYVELAEAQARLSSVTCTQNSRSVILQAMPSLGHATIADVATGSLSDMTVAPTESPATLVNILGIKVTAKGAPLNLSSGSWQDVPFNTTEIANHTTKTVSANNVVSGLATSLVGGLDLTLTLGIVELKLGPILTALRPVLTLAAPLLDGLVNTLLNALGIQLGQAVVGINGVRCGTAVLVA
jgi:uncharacterized membrane protein